MIEQLKKPQLHQSHLQMLYRCGHKFERIVLNGEREPATTPLVVGGATHLSTAFNLQSKIDKGYLLSKEILQDRARDDFIKTWNESVIVFSDEEAFQGPQKTRDLLQDQTIELVTEHHYTIAPQIRPVAVERPWVLEARGYRFDLAGRMDIDEGNSIRDTKTRKRNLGQAEVEHSEQYTVYALAKYILDKILPEWVYQDNLIKPTATRPAMAVSYRAKRTKDDFQIFFNRFNQAEKIIQCGAFTPANPCDWWCSKEFCGFAAQGKCRFFNSKLRDIARKPEIKKEESDNDRTKQLIADLSGLACEG